MDGGVAIVRLYRATDTNLKRHVALKVLPTAVASDLERETPADEAMTSGRDRAVRQDRTTGCIWSDKCTASAGGGVDTGTGRQYDVAPDERFLINTQLDAGDATAPSTLIQKIDDVFSPTYNPVGDDTLGSYSDLVILT